MTQDQADFDTFLGAFQAHLEGRGRSAHTLRAYLADLRQFDAWFVGHSGSTIGQGPRSSSSATPPATSTGSRRRRRLPKHSASRK